MPLTEHMQQKRICVVLSTKAQTTKLGALYVILSAMQGPMI
jgi:hypothetical protein